MTERSPDAWYGWRIRSAPSKISTVCRGNSLAISSCSAGRDPTPTHHHQRLRRHPVSLADHTPAGQGFSSCCTGTLLDRHIVTAPTKLLAAGTVTTTGTPDRRSARESLGSSSR
jgi:hypothetical protein